MIIFTQNILIMKKNYLSPSVEIASIASESYIAASGGNENFIIKPGTYDGLMGSGDQFFSDWN